MNELAWGCALAGLLLGGFGALIPGFPGSAVALLGLVSFAAITDFTILGPEALLLATLIAVAGVIAQLLSPVISARAAGGTAGVATGAAIGVLIGAFVPFPAAPLVFGWIGAILLGILGVREGVVSTLRGWVGVSSGCLVAVGADLVAVLALGAILAVADFSAAGW